MSSQASLTGTDECSGTGQGKSGVADSESDDEYGFIDYLDVQSTNLIKGLAATLHTEEEVDRYIEAEEKRWDRFWVKKILRRRKKEIKQSEDPSESPD